MGFSGQTVASPILHILRHALEQDMTHPMLRSIYSKRPFLLIVPGDDILIKVQKNAQTGLGREGMSRRHTSRNMITAGNNVSERISIIENCYKLEQVDSTPSTGSFKRQSSSNFGICAAGNSVSSLTRSGKPLRQSGTTDRRIPSVRY